MNYTENQDEQIRKHQRLGLHSLQVQQMKIETSGKNLPLRNQNLKNF